MSHERCPGGNSGICYGDINVLALISTLQKEQKEVGYRQMWVVLKQKYDIVVKRYAFGGTCIDKIYFLAIASEAQSKC